MGKMSYKKGGVEHHPLKTWSFNDQTEIGIYQGFRGENPDLDFIVKYNHWKEGQAIEMEYREGKLYLKALSDHSVV